MLSDHAFLRTTTRPNYEAHPGLIRVVDLFSGCGGLSLGLAEAALRIGRGIDVRLAVDSDPDIARVFASNFPKARVESSRVEAIFDGTLGDPPTQREREWVRRIGNGVHWLQGGPPCQGHSDLNNHTRRRDPRNRFYERMARAAEVLKPQVVLIENVPMVRNDTGHVVDVATNALIEAGFAVTDTVIAFEEIGVAQNRRRHTVLGLRDLPIEPNDALESLGKTRRRGVAWAIKDLEDIGECSPVDQPSNATEANRARMEYLLEHDLYDLPNHMRPQCHQGDHSYLSMYGRLRWDQPAQTITTGFGSMGQGRFVHPSVPRTITPHEAARLQGFPDWFDFTAGGLELRRGRWSTMIGNAVPPKLTMELGRILLRFMPG